MTMPDFASASSPMTPCRRLLAFACLLIPSIVHAQEDAAGHLARLRAAVVGIAVTPAGLPPDKPEPTLDGLNAPLSFSPKGGVSGSGTLVSPDGLILTAESLLVPGADITVVLEGRGRRKASIVGRDKPTGLALLKIEGTDLPHATLSPSKDVALGERVALLGRMSVDGNASAMVTDGLVSSTFDLGTGPAAMIQSTAPVLPGMGGGPLVRMKTGELIGIASHQYLPRHGVPFTLAIPADEYLKIGAELRSRGRVERATIGVSASLLPEDAARALGVPGRAGAVVIASVHAGGPAQRAGLRVGDAVLSVDGSEPPASAQALYQLIRARPPGATLALRVFRRGAPLVVQVVSEAEPGAK
jgi:serine protease Do